MTKKRNLTARRVESIRPPVRGQAEHFDATLPGFALRVTAKGSRSYILYYRPKVGPHAGKLRRDTIASASMLTLAEAREKARKRRRQVDAGFDPREIDRQERAGRRERARNTFGRVQAQFIVKHAKRHTRSWRDTRRILRNHVVPLWKDRPVDSIKRRDVIELLDSIARRHPVLANRVLAHVRKLFNWSMERGILEASPVALVKIPGGKEHPRDRSLTDVEIKALWPAFETAGYPFGPMMALLLLTLQRRGEVATMRWSDLDLEEKVWRLPSEATKARRAHVVPLSPPAIAILQSLPQHTGSYVFTTKAGEKPVSGYSRAKQRVEVAINATREQDGLGPLPGWHLHDLRRTGASGMARLGVPVDHIGRVLNHAPRGVTATVYDRHSYLPEKRRALELWASHIENLIRPASGNVVPLRAEVVP